jgi:double-stranded uracil-DNA glycosylase
MTSELIIPNLLSDHLKILFVGINPGLRSAAVGHHFAGYSNRFWRLLADSGLTEQRLTAAQDSCLLNYDFGITNIVARSSANAAELSRTEFEAGAEVFLALIQQHRPRIIAYLGKDSYRYVGKKRNFSWGIQPSSVFTFSLDFVLPNPSGLNRMPYQEQLYWYQQVKFRLDQTNSSPD